MQKQINESQKYPRSSYIIIIPILIILFLFIFSIDIWIQLFLGLILIVLLFSLFYLISLKFELEMNNLGISYRVGPFGRKKHLPINKIKDIQIISFDFVGVFGGWGIRKRKGKKAYIFNDDSFLLVKTLNTEYYFSIKNKTQFNELIQNYFDTNS